jgi:mono/diheme cytochrome c family protein
MARRPLLAGGALCVVLAGCALRPGGAAPAPPERRSTLDGVYTVEQAERGKVVFWGSCNRCHSTSEWSHPAFLGRRAGRSVGDFFNLIYEKMPPSAPLPEEEYAEVIAYMLQLNGLPPGEEELGTDDAELQTIVIEVKPGR